MDKINLLWEKARKLCLKKQYSISTAVFIVIASLVSYPSTAYAKLAGEEPHEFSDLEVIVANIIKKSVPIAGIILFAMLVIGGLMFLSSGGNPESLQKARSTITYAIAGIALLVLAWFALLFIERFTGILITEFRIGD